MATRNDTTTTEQPPAVLDAKVEGERVLASVERGEISLVVEAPRGFEAEDVEELLEDVPEKIEDAVELFDRGEVLR